MLSGVVGVIELNADDTDFGSCAVSEHLLDPVGSDDLSVVVKKYQVLPTRGFAPEVDELGEIESGFFPALDGNLVVLFKGLVIIKGL